MKQSLSLAATLLLTTPAVPAAADLTLPTNYGVGADAEVRESNPTQNRGNSTEIATRVRDGFSPASGLDFADRNSVVYLQFDLAPWTSGDVSGAVLRLTLRNNNITSSRIHDEDSVPPDFGRNGLAYYGLYGASFDESTLTYLNAPGLNYDGDVGTLDIDGSALHLGFLDFPEIGTQNHLPIGLPLDFSSPWLDAFLNAEAQGNPVNVAVIAVVHRNQGFTYGDPNFTKVGPEPPDWSLFNYLFNPKEQTTLNFDTSYEADFGNPTGEGSPWSGADNSTGTFSPSLLLPGIDADAPDYNVDFGTAYLPPISSFGGAAALPGPWNAASLGTTALDDTSGQSNAVELTLIAQSDSGSSGPPADEAGKLLHDNFYSNTAPWSVVFDGLFPGFYRIYVYAPGNELVTTGDVIVGSTFVSSLPGDASGSLIEGVSWASIDAESTDGTLELSAICSGFCGLAGLQLQYLPEPAGGLALGAAAMLVGALARRRGQRRRPLRAPR